jgi:Asp-tRNA(Asn)/Glu-tRNA(Gln) amidotransferase A subunit family amidase
VAAGIVPLAHAGDGGGSIRIPASCCGRVGLKPTRARNPLGPLFGDRLGDLVVEHVVSRSVRDTAAALDATAGPELGDPYTGPPPPGSCVAFTKRKPKKLRIAFATTRLGGGGFDPECRAATEAAAKLCADLGHIVRRRDRLPATFRIRYSIRDLTSAHPRKQVAYPGDGLMRVRSWRLPGVEFLCRRATDRQE